MTGAMMPAGADFVLMKEHAEITDLTSVRCIRTVESVSICYKGEDIKSGDTILGTGIRAIACTSGHIGGIWLCQANGNKNA